MRHRISAKRETPRRKRPELAEFVNLPNAEPVEGKKPAFKRERQINPDTALPFRDPRSKHLPCGRIICRGSDMTGLRERVGRRESEICQGSGCDSWCPVYPSEGRFPGEMHHVYGRGGGKRNDIAEDMEWLCHDCHAAAKIKKRIHSGIPEENNAIG